MPTDTEIKLKGFQILTESLGNVDAERFITLIQREAFDYTKWRNGLDEKLSIEQISQEAMALRNKTQIKRPATEYSARRKTIIVMFTKRSYESNRNSLQWL